MKIAVTFGVKYNGVDVVHPVDPRITGKTYMVFEGETWADARRKAEEYLGEAFAFDYPYEDEHGHLDPEFTRQITRHGYTEVVPQGEALRLPHEEARRGQRLMPGG